MNWIKISPFEDVSKTWGVYYGNLTIGSYTILVENNWDSYVFKGKKYVILT